MQIDPVSDRPVHVDFMRLAEGASVRLEIPVHFKGQGESPGLKKGGVLNIVRHEMNVICPADNIPNAIEVDVSKLDINETIHVGDLDLPKGVKSGLVEASRILRNTPGISIIHLNKRDIVRHPLVQRIVDAYEMESLSAHEAHAAKDEG